MRPSIPASAILALLASCAAPGAEVDEAPATATAVDPGPAAVADSVLRAITHGDPELLLRQVLPEAVIVATGPGRPPRTTTLDQMAAMIGPDAGFVERMWSPTVTIHGDIASVWAPYDFYRGGAFSHCGVDAFHLLRVEGRWRVQNLIYTTAQPPACDVHPDGPPTG